MISVADRLFWDALPEETKRIAAEIYGMNADRLNAMMYDIDAIERLRLNMSQARSLLSMMVNGKDDDRRIAEKFAADFLKHGGDDGGHKVIDTMYNAEIHTAKLMHGAPNGIGVAFGIEPGQTFREGIEEWIKDNPLLLHLL
jgi:hypothetical protein